MRFFLFSFIIMLMAFCNGNNDSETSGTDSTITENALEANEANTPQTAESGLGGCYIKILKRDTMVLHLRQNGDSVSGKMNFDNYEKDSSSGEVAGVIYGDTIKLWYNFQSEGMHSTAELFFKKEKASLIRGIGDVNNKDDTSFFADHSSIAYPADQTFSKIDCSKIALKYRKHNL